MAEEFKTKLADAGVTKLVFVRHASAAPPGGKAKGEYNKIHDWQRDDQMRPLTDKGKQQAKAARSWYNKSVGNKSNKVLVTSGARRASETLQILTEEQTKGGGIFASILGCNSPNAVATQATMDLVGSLHPAGIAPKCEEMFDTLGYGPMTKFYEKDGGKQAFDDYAELVVKEMCALVGKVGKNPGNTITSFGHAVFLNAVAMIVAEKVWNADDATIKALSELNLGESEGIILTKTASGMTMTHMKC